MKWNRVKILALSNIQTKGQVTPATMTRMKTITIKMHALDWLNERGRNLRGAFQLIEGVYFYPYLFCSRYRGLCDLALTPSSAQRILLSIQAK